MKPKTKIHHQYAKEMIVPYCVIEENIYFIANIEPMTIVFSDEKESLVLEKKEVHILKSEELIKRIYGQDHTPQTILKGWFSKFGEQLNSLWFVWVKCE